MLISFLQIHLLPDADELLSELVPDYNLANVITCGGVLFVLFMEQITFIMARKPTAKNNYSNNNSEQHNVIHTSSGTIPVYDTSVNSAGCSMHETATLCENSNNECSLLPSSSSSFSSSPRQYSAARRNSCSSEIRKQSKHREVSVISNIQETELDLFVSVMNSNSLRDLITAYVMEISIAVHSIIIGVDLGLLDERSQLTTLVSLMIALSFHQFVEGIGLGTTIQNSQSSLGNSKVAGFIAIFSSTMPLGILTGILSSSSPESDMQTAFKGVANALAAGSLLFISLTEMVGSYFNEPDLADRPWLKIGMMFSFAIGITFMSIIAIWA